MEVRVELLVMGPGLAEWRRWNSERWFPERGAFTDFEALVFRDLEVRAYSSRGLAGFAWPPAAPRPGPWPAAATAAGAGHRAGGAPGGGANLLNAGPFKFGSAALAAELMLPPPAEHLLDGAGPSCDPNEQDVPRARSRAEFARRNVFSQVACGAAAAHARLTMVCALAVDGDYSIHVRDRDQDLPWDAMIYRYAGEGLVSPAADKHAAGSGSGGGAAPPPWRPALPRPDAATGGLQCQRAFFLFAGRAPFAGIVRRLMDRHGYRSGEEGWHFPGVRHETDAEIEFHFPGAFRTPEGHNMSPHLTHRQSPDIRQFAAETDAARAALGFDRTLMIDLPKDDGASIEGMPYYGDNKHLLLSFSGHDFSQAEPVPTSRSISHRDRDRENPNQLTPRELYILALMKVRAANRVAEENGYLLPPRAGTQMRACKLPLGPIAVPAMAQYVQPAFVADLASAGVLASGRRQRIASLYALMAHGNAVYAYAAVVDDLHQSQADGMYSRGPNAAPDSDGREALGDALTRLIAGLGLPPETPAQMQAPGTPATVAARGPRARTMEAADATDRDTSFSTVDNSYDLLPSLTPGSAYQRAGPDGPGPGSDGGGITGPPRVPVQHASAHFPSARAAAAAAGISPAAPPREAQLGSALAASLERVRQLEAALARQAASAAAYRAAYEQHVEEYNRTHRVKLPLLRLGE